MLAGSLLGLLVLVRYLFVPLWALGLLGTTFAAVGSRTLLQCCLAYGGTALLVVVPWCVRNCLVLDALMPLGTQGGHVLAGKYVEDEIRGARWNSGPVAKLWAARKGRSGSYPYGKLARELRTSLAVEREVALMGQQAARLWLRQNWRRLPAVALVSLRAHARGFGTVGLAALACAFLGLVVPEARWLTALGLAIVAAGALTVALTVEASGRYSAPVRPVAYLAGSLGLTASISRLILASRRPSRV